MNWGLKPRELVEVCLGRNQTSSTPKSLYRDCHTLECHRYLFSEHTQTHIHTHTYVSVFGGGQSRGSLDHRTHLKVRTHALKGAIEQLSESLNRETPRLFPQFSSQNCGGQTYTSQPGWKEPFLRVG